MDLSLALSSSEAWEGTDYTYQTTPLRLVPRTGPLVGVYRVQDVDGGGPYAGNRSWMTLELLRSHGSLGDMKHPAPWQEGIPHERYAYEGKRGNRKFGFANLSQLQGWFTPVELLGLAKLGFKPTRIFVREGNIDFTTPTQLAYFEEVTA